MMGFSTVLEYSRWALGFGLWEVFFLLVYEGVFVCLYLYLFVCLWGCYLQEYYSTP